MEYAELEVNVIQWTNIQTKKIITYDFRADSMV